MKTSKKPRHDKDALAAFAWRLQGLAEAQVKLRTTIETRWIEDLRQYHGQYPPEIAEALKANEESRVFVNITRNKTAAGEARLLDMLFPVDDKNWGIEPTPVPELVNESKSTEPVRLTDGSDAQVQVDGRQVTRGDLARRKLEKAKDIAQAMSEEVDDQLTEAKYNGKCRDVIHHAALYGTGILKGPVVIGKMQRSWKKIETATGVVHVIEAKKVHRPTVEVVNPWNFFPDMAARTLEEAEFICELHPMTRGQVRQLLKHPGFDKEALRCLLQDQPRDSVNLSRVAELKSISGVSGVSWDNRYHIWEYSGPIEKDDLENAGVELPEDIKDDPLIEFEANVWFCQGQVIKAMLNPMETETRPYSVFNWEKDDNSIFGYGVPALMRHPQKVINGAWRMILDNAGLCTGPQVVMNRTIIEPVDGNWKLKPRKLWTLTRQDADVRTAFNAFNIPSHQAELSAIFEAARQLADEETSLPLIAQGEQASHITQTASGMSMLMNSAAVVMKRVVKNWDDDITETFISRMYHWNMQFSKREEIKGDFEVHARGTSALLIKDLQAQNVMQLVNLAASPAFAPFAKLPQIFRLLARLLQLPEEEVVKLQEEIEAEQQQMAKMQAQQGEPAQDPATVNAQVQLQIKQLELQGLQEKLRLQQYEIDTKREIELTRLATEQEMTLEELQVKLGLGELKAAHEREMQALKAQYGAWTNTPAK